MSDFVKADKNGSGHLSVDGAPPNAPPRSPLTSAPEFSSYFGLNGDLFLGRVVATMDGRLVDGNIDLVEFLNGVACFAASSKEEKDLRIRAFAFQMMDLRHEGRIPVDHLKKFATLAYEQFAGSSSSEWGDTGRSLKAVKNVSAVHKAIDRCCGEADVTFSLFQRLAADLPLVIAPAHFIWSTFERASPQAAQCSGNLAHPTPVISPSCKVLCAAMALRGHREFVPRKTGFSEQARALEEPTQERMPPAASRQEWAQPAARPKAQASPLERTFSRDVNPPGTPPMSPMATFQDVGVATLQRINSGGRPSASPMPAQGWSEQQGGRGAAAAVPRRGAEPGGGWPETRPARGAAAPAARAPSPITDSDEPRLKRTSSREQDETLRQEVAAHLDAVASRPAGMSRMQASKQTPPRTSAGGN